MFIVVKLEESMNNLTNQLLGIDNLDEINKSKIRKKFYISILSNDYYAFKLN